MRGNFMTPREKEIFNCRIVVNTILEKFHSGGTTATLPSDIIDMMVHCPTVLEREEDEELQEELLEFLNCNKDLIQDMFSNFEETRSLLEKTLLSGFCYENTENLSNVSTFHVFYETLWGLWLIDEYDPTDGLAWSYLNYVVEQIDPKDFGMIKKSIAEDFLDRQSLSPIQELWKKILHR